MLAFTPMTGMNQVPYLNRRESADRGIAPPVIQKHAPPPKHLMKRATSAQQRRAPPPVPGSNPSNSRPQQGWQQSNNPTSPRPEVVGLRSYHQTTKARRGSLTGSNDNPTFRDQMRTSILVPASGQRKKWGGGSKADTDVTTLLMTRMVQDAQTLDDLRAQAAVAVNAETGAPILHGMIEEIIELFRNSSRVTLDSVNSLAEKITEKQVTIQQLLRENGELKTGTMQLSGVVKQLEDRDRDMEAQIMYMTSEVEDGNTYIASLESALNQKKTEVATMSEKMEASAEGFNELLKQEHEASEAAMLNLQMLRRSTKVGEAPQNPRADPRAQADALLQEMDAAMEQPISPLTGRKHPAGVHFSDNEGINIKPFSNSGSTPKSMKAGSYSLEEAADPQMPQKKLILRLHKYVVENQIDMSNQWKRMDINGDGFLSFDELYEALQGLGLQITFSDAKLVHKYIAKGKELVSLQEFFDQVETPPVVERKKIKVQKKTGAVKNLNMDETQLVETEYEYESMAPKMPKATFNEVGPQKALGQLAGNRNRLRSQDDRQGGWDGNISPKRANDTFGNIFEAQNFGKEQRKRAQSSFMFTEGGVTKFNLPEPPAEATNVLKKISSYIKHHNILMADAMHNIDIHADGYLNQVELKKVIITKIGCHISVAESMFVFRYLNGLGTAGDNDASILDLEAALLKYKPPKGKLIAD
ncbi:hypothetical protein TL16_g06657 [Triparma laevis f. inornata]|uniref:EF-hand domain-containing protein n=1 Tax=Triparma laevis f. inornata TaxID=1714386 RepID=A0A9W7ANZ4_9STRA|nr:hypothetical protein TL16_g06657 [Triparma laevis f. inornata]